MCSGVTSIGRQTLVNNVHVPAKAAKISAAPTILTTEETENLPGSLWPQRLGVFPGNTPIGRTSMDSREMATRGPSTRVIDLGGRRAIPGLNDPHIHLIRGGLNDDLEFRWDGVPSPADALRMLREQAIRTPAPQWVRMVGGGNEFPFAERRMPTLAEVNAAAPDTPALHPPPRRPRPTERGRPARSRRLE